MVLQAMAATNGKVKAFNSAVDDWVIYEKLRIIAHCCFEQLQC